jgi:hypothetical protein
MPEDFSPQQSLQLIQTMIDKTKSNMGENRFYFLLWGWTIFLAIMVQFVLKVMLHHPQHYLVWLVTFVSAIISMVRSRRDRHKTRVRTYIGDSMGYLWMGIGISFFVMTFIISTTIGWLHAWPFMILMYGLGTFISGKILQFNPMVIGGIVNWLLAGICAFVPYDYQLLLAAAAIVTSYLIPAYLIQKES